MKRLILEDFTERIAKNVNYAFLIKASALDPRFKRLKFVEDKTKRELVFKNLKDEAEEHLKKEKDKDSEKQAEGDLSEDAPIEKKRKLGYEYDESDDEDVSDSAEVEIKREVEGYQAEPEVPKDEEDIMSWWRKNRIKYPNLARLAR